MKQIIKRVAEVLNLATMPLSISGVFLGSLLAVADFHVSWTVVASVLLAATSLHVYQYGKTKVALIPAVLFAVMSVYFSFGKIFLLESLLMLLFTYFIMRLAAGFVATGSRKKIDGLVLCLLTGPVAVIGAYYLCSHSFGSWVLLFPAMSVGMICAATAGLTDGYSKIAVCLMMLAGLVLMTVYPFLRIHDPAHFRFAIMIPIYIMYMVKMSLDNKRTPDTYQPMFSLCLFVLVVLLGLGFISYLF